MILTTITPVWKRPEIFRRWIHNLVRNSIPEVRHLIYLVGEDLPDWWAGGLPNFTVVCNVKEDESSIGHYHNLGAAQAETEWIMKLDVDAFPNEHYFKELLSVLAAAGPREWFNGGMFYLNERYASSLLSVPLGESVYKLVMGNRQTYSASPYLLPAASNFICRRKDYLELGGCSNLFLGYGWEDYQQIYMLEKYQQGRDPLPGVITLENVTKRCREALSRRKAKELWMRNPWLCLLHYWHSQNKGVYMSQNRQVLFNYVSLNRKEI